MTFGQVVYIFGINLYIFRILIIIIVIRIILKREFEGIELSNGLDKVIIIWQIWNVLSYTLLTKEISGLINALGHAFNALGLYFVFRCYIRDIKDIKKTMKFIGFVIIPVIVPFFFIEFSTGRNLFYLLGGVKEYSVIRYGSVRCQGPFTTSILAGTFAATSLPFICAVFKKKKIFKSLLALGMGVFMVVAARTSGGLIALLSSMFALFIWLFRSNLKIIIFLLVILLAVLNFAMNAPIWYLIARASALFGGGHGYHRAQLINQAIYYINEWWLIGSTYTAHWMSNSWLPSDPNNVDCTSQYIKYGLRGGVLSVFLSFSLIGFAFKNLHDAYVNNSNNIWIIWCIGVSIFAHSISFISIVYFDQTIVYFYLSIVFSIAALNCRPQHTSMEQTNEICSSCAGT